MIERINNNRVNNTSKPLNNQPHFKGAIDVAVRGLLLCEQHPMVNVSVLDLTTAIGPRTAIEGSTNIFSGLEAFRRESSGLIVNCLIPSVIVLGFAKLLEKPIMGAKTAMGSCWANEGTINKVSDLYSNAEGSTTKEKIAQTYKDMFNTLEGIDGDIDDGGLKKFSEFGLDEHAQKIADIVCSSKDPKASKKAISAIYSEIVKKTHISEKIKFSGDKGFFGQNLQSLVVESSKMLREFHEKKILTPDAISEFAKKSTKLLTRKSLLGLGIIIPLAISMQPINRWITAKTSGKKGAPIYKDFKDSNVKELTPEEKSGLFRQKIISVGTMIGVAMLSIMKMPNLQMFKNISQFSGLFPTMDQARLVSTATFASRMASSEDKNELKESTMRDIATFVSFYFIGDYVSKATANVIEHFKPEVKLINNVEHYDKNANIFKKFGHWVTKTSLKSSGEVLNKEAEKWRSLCQFSNIMFSLVALGIVIPKVYRHYTDKAREKELKNAGLDSKKYYPGFKMNNPQEMKKFLQQTDKV